MCKQVVTFIILFYVTENEPILLRSSHCCWSAIPNLNNNKIKSEIYLGYTDSFISAGCESRVNKEKSWVK